MRIGGNIFNTLVATQIDHDAGASNATQPGGSRSNDSGVPVNKPRKAQTIGVLPLSVGLIGRALYRPKLLKFLAKWEDTCSRTRGGNGSYRIAAVRIQEVFEKNLPSLDLKKLGLKFLPDCLDKLELVKNLDVSENELHYLPDLPPRLVEFDASLNALGVLPMTLPSGLKILNVDKNRLSSLPDLPRTLRDLCISRNRFTSLPPLPRALGKLNIRDNCFTTLPVLPDRLQHCDVSANQLTSLPAGMGALNYLTILNVSQNELTELQPVSWTPT